MKERLDTILKAFEDEIRNQNYFDIVYSEKMGYLRILVESPEEGAIVLDTPEKMMEYLCGDVIGNVIYSPEDPKRSEDDMFLTKYEKAESRRRLISIFESLGMDKEHSSDLVEQQLRAYQGDERGLTSETDTLGKAATHNPDYDGIVATNMREGEVHVLP